MIELLRRRRSIRRYTSQPVSRQSRDPLIEALLRSPTSHNGKSWEFIVVDDAQLLAELSTAKPHGGTFLKDAPLAVVIAAYSTKSDVWVEDTAIAGILAQAAAEWMKPQLSRQILSAPECQDWLHTRTYGAGRSSSTPMQDRRAR